MHRFSGADGESAPIAVAKMWPREKWAGLETQIQSILGGTPFHCCQDIHLFLISEYLIKVYYGSHDSVNTSTVFFIEKLKILFFDF